MTSTRSNPGSIGWEARDFSLKGVDGRHWKIRDVKGTKGLVVMFICNHCPYVRAITTRLVSDAHEMSLLDIGLIAIMPNDTKISPGDAFDKMVDFSKACKFNFPYVIDQTQDTAKSYKASCTPDFYGFNSNLKLQYRGRLDDSGREPPVDGNRHELLEAMYLIATTGCGPEIQHPSIGCSIKWRP